MKFWIVVVNYNGWEDTDKCLRSLHALTAPAETVVVDNASRADRCDEFRARFPWCHLVREPRNGGWAGGNNAGLRYALERGADQVLLLNNDTTVACNLVEELRQAVRQFPGYGIMGPVINHMGEPDVVMTDGCLFNRPGTAGFFERKPVRVDEPAPLSVSEVDIVNGCAMLVSRAVCERIGLVDEQFFLIHEESDFCLRARQAGFRCGVINRVLVWHKGSSSFKRTGQRTQRYYDARNLRLLLKKHGRSHREGRRLLSAYKTYANYVYYRYAMELENGCAEAADAVVEGTYDALTNQYGPHRARSRWGKGALRLLFATRRRLTAWRGNRVQETDPRAAAVR